MAKPTKPLPSPKDRPDLYDGYDGMDPTVAGRESNPVEVPDRLKKLVARKKKEARQGKNLMAG